MFDEEVWPKKICCYAGEMCSFVVALQVELEMRISVISLKKWLNNAVSKIKEKKNLTDV